jgi:hypothetical protein
MPTNFGINQTFVPSKLPLIFETTVEAMLIANSLRSASATVRLPDPRTAHRRTDQRGADPLPLGGNPSHRDEGSSTGCSVGDWALAG